jgi:hypothetical protein
MDTRSLDKYLTAGIWQVDLKGHGCFKKRATFRLSHVLIKHAMEFTSSTTEAVEKLTVGRSDARRTTQDCGGGSAWSPRTRRRALGGRQRRRKAWRRDGGAWPRSTTAIGSSAGWLWGRRRRVGGGGDLGRCRGRLGGVFLLRSCRKL